MSDSIIDLFEPTQRGLGLCEAKYCHQPSTHKATRFSKKRFCDTHFREWNLTLNLVRVRNWEIRNGKTKPLTSEECIERAFKHEKKGNFRLRDYYAELAKTIDDERKTRQMKELLSEKTKDEHP